MICAIGAYTVHSAMLDIWFMMLFGVIGYLFKKLNYPLAPMVLALVLGDRAEDSFRQSMLIAQGDLRIFFSNGLVGGITGARAGAAVLAARVARRRPSARGVTATGKPAQDANDSPAAEAFGPWNPGIESQLPRELLPLATLFRPENVRTDFATALELPTSPDSTSTISWPFGPSAWYCMSC